MNLVCYYSGWLAGKVCIRFLEVLDHSGRNQNPHVRRIRISPKPPAPTMNQETGKLDEMKDAVFVLKPATITVNE